MMLVQNKNVLKQPNRILLFLGLFFVFVIAALVGSAALASTSPAIITYQGKLLQSGLAATTTKNIIFNLYDSSSGGTLLYTAAGTLGTPATVSVLPINGIFTINLGDTGTNTLAPSIFQNNTALFLEVTVNGETLTPRKQITASPFSFNSKYLDGVAATSTPSSSTYIPISDSSGNFNLNKVTSTGIVATGSSVLATTTISSATITSSSLTTANIATGNISTALITTTTIGSANITTANFQNITSTNAYFTTLNLASLVTGAVTSSNLNTLGLVFTTASGTSATSTNSFATNLAAVNGLIANVTTTNLSVANLSLSSLFNFSSASGTSITSTNAAFTSSIKLTSIASCNLSNQALQTQSDGSVVCGTLATGGGGSGSVGTSTINYLSFYNSTNSVTGTPLVQLSNGALTITTNTSLTSLSATSVTTTNLSAQNGTVNVTNATIIGLNVNSVAGTNTLAYLGLNYPALATSTFLAIANSTSLAYLGLDYPALATSTFLNQNYTALATSTFLNQSYPALATSTFLSIAASTTLSYLSLNYPSIASSTFLNQSYTALATSTFLNQSYPSLATSTFLTIAASTSFAFLTKTQTFTGVNTFSGTSTFATTTITSLTAGDVTSTNMYANNYAGTNLLVTSLTTTNFFTTSLVGAALRVTGQSGCTGSQALQTDGSGNVSCGNITTGGASSGGGWTTNMIGSITLTTNTDRVAIGPSTTPYAKLTVLSGGANTTTMALVPANGQNANVLELWDTYTTVGAVYTPGGNFGLGTTTPSNRLTVVGTVLITGTSTLATTTISTLSVSSATSTNLFSNTLSFVSASGSAMVLVSATSTNLNASGAVTLGNVTSTNLFSAGISFTNLFGSNATTTNLSAQNGTVNFTGAIILGLNVNSLSGTNTLAYLGLSYPALATSTFLNQSYTSLATSMFLNQSYTSLATSTFLNQSYTALATSSFLFIGYQALASSTYLTVNYPAVATSTFLAISASTSFAFLANNQTFTGQNIFSNSTTLATTTFSRPVGIGTVPGSVTFNSNTLSALTPLSVLEIVGDDNSNRHAAISGQLILNNTTLNSASRYGLLGTIEVPASSTAGSSGSLRGLQGLVTHASTGTLSLTYGAIGTVDNKATGTITTAIGSAGTISNNVTGTIGEAIGSYATVQNITGGTITNVEGLDVYVSNAGVGTFSRSVGAAIQMRNSNAAGTITDAYGISIGGPGFNWTNNGFVSSSYGLYIDPSTNIGNTSSFAIYSGSLARSYFAGNVAIGVVTSSAMFAVSGTSTFATTTIASLNFFNATGTNATTTNLAIQGVLNCSAGNQALQTGSAGQVSCGTLTTGSGTVGTSTINYLAFYTGTNTVTGTPLVQFSNGSLSVTTNTTFANQITVTGTSTFATGTFSGRVGVGTTTPQTFLHVVGLGANNDLAYFQGDNGSLGIADPAAVGNAVSLVGLNAGLSGYGPLSLRASGADQVYIATSGFVGVGTNFPSTTLTVFGTSTVNGGGTFSASVGIGTTSPQAKLHVVGLGANNDLAFFQGDNAALDITDAPSLGGAVSIVGLSGNLGGYGPLSFRAGVADQFYLATNGNVGIGTTTPSSTLTVAGTMRVTGTSTLATTTITSATITTSTITYFNFQNATGTLFVVTNGVITTSSITYLNAQNITTTNFVATNATMNRSYTTDQSVTNGSTVYRTCMQIYMVSSSPGAPIVDCSGNNVSLDRQYRLTAWVSGTGNKTGSQSVVNSDGTNFSIVKGYEFSTTSNNVNFFVSNTVPWVQLWNNPAVYQVNVYTEEMDTVGGSNRGNPWGVGTIYSTGAGTVGINTTSTAYALSVSGTMFVSGVTVLATTTISSSTIGYLNLTNLTFTSATGTNLYIAATSTLAGATFSGNVGIGTSTPQAKLQVTKDYGAFGGEQLWLTGATDSNGQLRIGYNTGDFGLIQPLSVGSGYRNLALNPYGGNVGIGTSTPSASLTVYTTAANVAAMMRGAGGAAVGIGSGSTGPFINGYTDSAGTASTPLQIQNIPTGIVTLVQGGGNVAIGTSTVGGTLRVDTGTTDANQLGMVRFLNPYATSDGRFSSMYLGAGIVSGSAGELGYYSYPATPANAGVTINNYGDSQATQSLFVRQGGRVGIGNVLPSSTLHISSNALYSALKITSSTASAYNVLDVSNIGRVSLNTNTSSLARLNVNAEAGETAFYGTHYANDATELLKLQRVGSGGMSFSFSSGWTEFNSQSDIVLLTGGITQSGARNEIARFVSTTGNFGVGTSSPSARLSITGTSTGNLLNIMRSDGTSGLFVNSNGFVGVSTTNPQSKLSVSGGNILIDNAQALQFFDNGGTARTVLSYTSANNVQVNNLAASGGLQFQNVNDVGAIGFYTGASAAARMMILAGGNIGVSTTNPNYKLEVNGTFGVSGTSTLATTSIAMLGVGTSTPQAGLHVYKNTLLVDTPNSIIASTTATGLSPYSVYVSGKYAYVANYNGNSLSVIDISNPASPATVSTIATGVNPQSVYISGKYAYIVNSGGNSLSIIDISNPASPATVSTMATTANPQSVYISGKYAYLTNFSSNSLSIIDISNPASPATVSTTTTGAGPAAIYVSGRYAYVTNFTSATLSIVDISNPMNPVTVSTTATGVWPSSVYVSGKYAYVANANSNSLSVIDISNPASPSTVSTPATGANPRSVYVSGKYAYVANYGGTSLSIIDISNPASPTTVSTPATGANPRSVYVSGKYAYVANTGGNSLSILDLGGADISVANIGNIVANDLTVSENVDIGNNLYVKTAINVGMGGIYSQGAITIASTTLSTLPLFTVYGTSTMQNIMPSASLTYDLGASTTRWNNLWVGTANIGTSTWSITQDSSKGFAIFDQPNGLGNKRFSISTNGMINVGTSSVGIGTTTPQAKLHITNGSLLVDSPSARLISSVGTPATMLPYSVFVSGKYAYTANGTNNSVSVVDVSDPANLVIVGEVSGLSNPRSIHVSGKYAYVVNRGNDTVSVIDVSDPFTPVVVGATSVGYLAQSIYVSGKYAYVINNGSSISILDISNPKAPIMVSDTYPGICLDNRSIYVSGKYAYVGCGFDGLIEIIDISNPVVPTLAKWFSVGVNAQSIYVSGKYAYVTNYGANTISIVDTSKTAATGQVGVATVGTNPSSIYVSGKYAYVTNYGSSNISIVDISSSTAPTQIGTVAVGLNPISIYVSGKYAYVGSLGNNALSVVDIGGADISTANIGNIATNDLTVSENADIGNNLYIKNGLNVGGGGIYSQGAVSILATSSPTALAVFGTSTFSSAVGVGTSSPQAGLHVYDNTLLVDGPVTPIIIGSVSSGLSAPQTLSVSGKYAYVANYGNGANGTVSVVDISNNVSPTVVGTTISIGGPIDIKVSGKYAYVADWGGSNLRVVDISNPTAPTQVGQLGGQSSPHALYVSGKYAYVANWGDSSLRVVDISNPTAPTQVGSVGSLGTIRSVYVSGRYAYLVGEDGSLHTVDVNVPSSPVSVGSVGSLGLCESIYVSGKYAYVTDYNGNLRIVNISSSTAPTPTASVSGLGLSTAVYVSGKYAYVTDYNGNLRIVNISSSTAPITIGLVSGMGSAYNVQVTGKYAYVVDNSGVLRIVDIKGADISAANIGNVATNNLTVWESADIGNNLSVRSGVNIGMGGLYTSGELSVGATTTFQSNVRINTGWLCVDNNGTCTGANTAGTVYAVSAYTLGADLAENYPSIEDLEPGDVVAVDPNNPVAIIKTTSTYANTMLGIISTKPGVLLNRASTSSYPVALAGKVPVKVSLENGPIAIGDKLTSASVPGFAMKATADGTIIATALESYDSSSTSTTIMAFVHLGWNSTALNTALAPETNIATSTYITSNTLLTSIIEALRGIGVYLEQGVVRATEFVASRIRTDELCVGGTCVNESQLQELLVKNQISTSTVVTPLINAIISTTTPTDFTTSTTSNTFTTPTTTPTPATDVPTTTPTVIDVTTTTPSAEVIVVPPAETVPPSAETTPPPADVVVPPAEVVPTP